MERIDVSRKDYDPKVSRIPELIEKNPGEDAVLPKFSLNLLYPYRQHH